jgi:iron transport multicopper oxidase
VESIFQDVTSSITYNSSASLSESLTVDDYFPVNDTELVPVITIAPPSSSRTIELEATFETLDDGKNYALFNNISYHSPLVPAILRSLP